MIILIIFAFIAGVVTVLSPCILPLLPIILSSSVGSQEEASKKPYGVMLGFILSFTFFTLFLSALVKATGVSAELLRTISIVVIAGFGLSLLFPKFQAMFEHLFSKLSSFAPQTQGRKGFGGGLLVGLSLGLLWTPCVGPILAAVISLAVIGDVSFAAFLITLSYSVGTAIPMLFIIKGGALTLKKFPWLVQNLANVQKVFGVIMIATGIMIALNLDRKFQTFILDTFPSYGTGLTKLEDIDLVKNQLESLDDTSPKLSASRPSSANNKNKIKAPELVPGGTWINSEPLNLAELTGKVVLIDFWTYSCINCQRTLPYLRTWWEKYEDDGLVIIGVHSPEFEFEKEYDNVVKAAADFNLTYPIVQDNDFRTWRAYSNRYWPAKYLIDKDGYVRYTHFGEGKYDETEAMIQLLLEETGTAVNEEISNPTYANSSSTPESYLGYGRIARFASPEKIVRDKVSTYSKPTQLGKNQLAYEGAWRITEEYANPSAGSNLYLNFEAKDVFLVMNNDASSGKTSSTVRVYLDDSLVKEITVDSDSLYTLVELPEPGQHLLRLEFVDGTTEIYAFTFG